MSATVPKSSHLPNPQSSPQSNIQYGDKNQGNSGYIGHGSGNFVASGNNSNWQLNFTQVTKTEDENELDSQLDRLLNRWISRDALHDSLNAPPECHPGTRNTVCTAITKWMSDSEESPLLWLHAPAGVGKSVIAKTMSTRQDQVVATYFFSTSSDKSAATLFPTLAWQLAKNVPETKQHIVAALKGSCSLQTSQIERQFDQLIIQPLRKCTRTVTSGLVMVIDGVDECVDEDKQTEFLKILKRAGEGGSLPLRFLICSRPEPHIRTILETTDDDHALAKLHTNSRRQRAPTIIPANMDQSGIPIVSEPKQQSSTLPYYHVWIKIKPYLLVATARLDASLRRRLRRATALPSDAWMLYKPVQLGVDRGYSSPEIHDELDKICRRQVISRIQIGLSEESKDDVKKYLEDKFKEICSSDSITSEEIDGLVERSCGQFLYASIIVKLLDNSGFSPKEVLEMAQSSSLPSPDLDKLYGAILDKAEEVMRREQTEKDLAIMRDVFAILLVLWANVQLADIQDSFPIIECLLVLKKGKLKRILRKLHSILDIIPEKSIRVYHRSFFEFLQHQRRSGDHCIAYPIALRRFLFLLSRVVLRYPFRRYCGQLQDNDKKQTERIRNMVLEFPRNFFRRSVNPTKLANFHAWVHTFFMILLWRSSFWLNLNFWDYLFVSRVPTPCIFFVRYSLIMILFIIVGSLIPFLMCYMTYVHRSIVRYPLFHPFLHPFLVRTSDFLLSR